MNIEPIPQPEDSRLTRTRPLKLDLETSAAIAATALSGAWLFLATINAGPLWRDEVNSVNLVEMPLNEMWKNLNFDSCPLLWLMLLRLWLRLRAEGAGDAHARAALMYLNEPLRRELERPSSSATLRVKQGRGSLTSSAERFHDMSVAVRLADVQRGVREAVETLRAKDPEVWSGRRFEPCSSLVLEVATG